MTRHYTHIGELAAGRAVASLPSVMSESKQEPTKREEGGIMREIQTLAESINAKNWREQKSVLLKILTTINAAN
jgi:hypothetical protein